MTIPKDDKKWLESHSRRTRLSSAEIIRRAIGDYRRRVSKGSLKRVLHETAGKWRSLEQDGQDYVDGLRTEWEPLP